MDLTDGNEEDIRIEHLREEPAAHCAPEPEELHRLTSEPHMAATPERVRFLSPLGSTLESWPAVHLMTALGATEVRGRAEERRRRDRRLGERRRLPPPSGGR